MVTDYRPPAENIYRREDPRDELAYGAIVGESES